MHGSWQPLATLSFWGQLLQRLWFGFLGWFPQRLWVIVLLPHSLFHPFPFVYSVAAVEVKASLSTSKANEICNWLKMRTVLPVSLASTKEAGSQTSSENELVSDCWKLYPCASVAVGVKWGFDFVVGLEGPVCYRKDNQSWEEEAIGVNKHGQESFHGECVGESSPLNIKVEPGKDQWRDSLCSVDKISNSVF